MKVQKHRSNKILLDLNYAVIETGGAITHKETQEYIYRELWRICPPFLL